MSFEEAAWTGLARDGGLMVPEAIPDVQGDLEEWRTLPYRSLAVEIFRRFVDMDSSTLAATVERSYRAFRHPEVTPIVPVGGLHIVELFHGPTLAFKDIALQWLAQIFETVLARRGGELNLLAATSGDTGSAAIAAVRGLQRVRIFVLYPLGRISSLQERQMTTVLADNVFCIAVQGTFDDGQAIVKSLFRDLAFRDRLALGAVNSVNWARLLPQMVYYFYAAFRVMERTGAPRVQICVPTGNFGNFFAGWLATQMGLPVERLILATNANDILERFFRTGLYERGPVHATLSPSMDIQVASNFERYLYYHVGRDPDQVRDRMATFETSGRLLLPTGSDGRIDDRIVSGRADDDETLATIRDFYARHRYLLDPHSAVAVHVARRHADPQLPTLCLATAHPAKFPDAILRATGADVAYHPLLDDLEDRPTRRTVLPASVDAVRRFIETAVTSATVPLSPPVS